MKKITINFFIITLSILFLTSCASFDFSRRVVQQGNLLPKSKVDKIKVGMSRHDVIMILGSSLLNPPFDTTHMDYTFTYRKGNSATTIRHLVIYLKDDKVVRIVTNKS